MRENDIFRTFENADDDFIEKLSVSPRLTDAEKERMFGMSMRNIKKTQTSVDDRKSITKQSRPKHFGGLIAAAACIALISGLGVFTSLMKKADGFNDYVKEAVTADVKTNDEAAPAPDMNEAEDSVQFGNAPAQSSGQYQTEKPVPKDISGTYSSESGTVVLNDDGSGTLTFQDTVPIVWNDKEIKTTDGSYPYTVSGYTITINIDGTELTFSREAELPQQQPVQ